MSQIVVLSQDTLVFRRSKTELSDPGAWHLAKDGRVRVTLCANYISHLHAVDISTLGEIPDGDLLCSLCRQSCARELALVASLAV